MKAKTLSVVAAVCSAAICVQSAHADTTVIPENGTLTVGGSGADPYNKQNNFIVFSPGSTLVVTQNNGGTTIWATIVATNGEGTVNVPVGSPRFQSNVIATGAGSLTLTGMTTANFGLENTNPIMDIRNIMAASSVQVNVFDSSLLSLPSSANCKYAMNGTSILRLCGYEDMFPGQDEFVVGSGKRFFLCTEPALPAGKTIHVRQNGLLVVRPLSFPDWRTNLDGYKQKELATLADSFETSGSFELDAGATLIVSNSCPATFRGAFSGKGKVVFASQSKVTLTGDSTGFEGSFVVEAAGATLVLSNANALGDGQLRAASGAHVVNMSGAKVSMSSGEAHVSGESPVSIVESCIDDATWWFDFSDSSTRYYPAYALTNKYEGAKDGSGNTYVERVVDRRNPLADRSLWNRRMYSSKGTLDDVVSTHPRIPASARQNGLEYLTLPNTTRLPFSDGTGANSSVASPAQLVVMVFGSQSGGGAALVATAEGAFARAGATKNHGITTNTAHDVWLDGTRVANPPAQPLSGGWQIVSIALDGLSFKGLGFAKTYETSDTRGGQNYGEVIVFADPVDERIRLETELYLAKKWGLEANYSSAAKERLEFLRREQAVRVRLTRSAAPITVEKAAMEIEGYFEGPVRLDNGHLLVSLPRPYEVPDIPSEGRTYWIDPDDEGTILYYNTPSGAAYAQRTNEVRAVRDKSRRVFSEGLPALYGVSMRMPSLIREARGFGPVRGWLDFNDYYDTTEDGNTLRFVNYTAECGAKIEVGSSSGFTLASMSTRTAFIVQDSVRGGGNPLLSEVGGGTIAPRADGDPAQSIWVENKPAAFKNGENRLDGEIVDYKNGFGGRPELFTVRGTGTVNTPFIGYYLNSHHGVANGEIIGEMLLYSTALEDETVVGIESYLMRKWLKTLPAGFADVSEAVVSGTGSVHVAETSLVPKFAGDFVGSVSVANGAFAMEVGADGTVSRSLICPSATLDLPAACSITLDFARRVTGRRVERTFTLVEAAGGVSGVEWTLTAGRNAPSGGYFRTSGEKIEYVVPSTGSLIIVQ